jgi:lipoyl(octanoyl) transferase
LGALIETSLAQTLKLKVLGVQDYVTVWQNMQQFTQARTPETLDEVWLVQHPPVFTLGRNGKAEHILQVTDIPIVNIDRGGQVTYHAPGQLVAYLLLDIRRKQVAVRDLVMRIEQSIIELLSHYAITAQGDREAPGVYVNGAKIAALGLRVTRGYTYHGLSLNVDMDLSPFQQINPCGYAGLQVTQCKDLGLEQMPFELAGEWVQCFAQQMDYHLLDWCQD